MAVMPVDGNGQGYGKTVAALVAGASTTIIMYVLSCFSLHPPDAVSNAIQTLLTVYCVYRIPHDIGAPK